MKTKFVTLSNFRSRNYIMPNNKYFEKNQNTHELNKHACNKKQMVHIKIFTKVMIID